MEDKAKIQQQVFDAFLRTQAYAIRPERLWTNRGVGPPIDFVSRELGIGVELTEWRGEKKSEYVVQRDVFRDEILAAIDARGSAGFQENGTGWTVVLNLKDRPPKTRSKS